MLLHSPLAFDSADQVRYITYSDTIEDCSKPERGWCSWTDGSMEMLLAATTRIRLMEMKNLERSQPLDCGSQEYIQHRYNNFTYRLQENLPKRIGWGPTATQHFYLTCFVCIWVPSFQYLLFVWITVLLGVSQINDIFHSFSKPTFYGSFMVWHKTLNGELKKKPRLLELSH